MEKHNKYVFEASIRVVWEDILGFCLFRITFKTEIKLDFSLHNNYLNVYGEEEYYKWGISTNFCVKK